MGASRVYTERPIARTQAYVITRVPICYVIAYCGKVTPRLYMHVLCIYIYIYIYIHICIFEWPIRR